MEQFGVEVTKPQEILGATCDWLPATPRLLQPLPPDPFYWPDLNPWRASLSSSSPPCPALDLTAAHHADCPARLPGLLRRGSLLTQVEAPHLVRDVGDEQQDAQGPHLDAQAWQPCTHLKQGFWLALAIPGQLMGGTIRGTLEAR